MKILLAFFLFINSSLFASYNESIRQELGKALTDGKKADEMIETTNSKRKTRKTGVKIE